ncbi:unnamed protein product [Brassica oleracea]
MQLNVIHAPETRRRAKKGICFTSELCLIRSASFGLVDLHLRLPSIFTETT